MRTVIVNTKEVSCYGLSPSRHPLVYLPLDPVEQIAICPYCSANYLHEDATQSKDAKAKS